MRCLVLITLISFVVAEPKYVARKLCRDVDSTQCTVHSVVVDPCDQGKGICVLKRNKNYAVTLDLVPRFSATKLKVAILGDIDNSGEFATAVKVPTDACTLLSCPVESQERRIFDVYLSLDKRATGKFPVAVKLWNEEQPSEVCCVSFTVKLK